MSSPLSSQAHCQVVTLDTSNDLSLTIDAKDHPEIVLITVTPDCTQGNIHLEISEDALCHCVIKMEGDSAVPLTLNITGTIQKNATLCWHCVTLSRRSTTQTLVSTVQGDGGESEVNWAFACDAHITHNIRATNAFVGRNGTGEMTLKGVARESGKATVYGMIDIGLHGTGTNTYLTEDVLMLSPTAKIDAIPALEIKTNDVKASHSATISRVTKEDLFYFQSRGIDRHTAEAMYIDGFLGEILEKIPLEIQ